MTRRGYRGGRIVVVPDETPETTGVVGEVGVCLLAYLLGPGVLKGAHDDFHAVDQGSVGVVKVGGGGVTEEESAGSPFGLDETQDVWWKSEGVWRTRLTGTARVLAARMAEVMEEW